MISSALPRPSISVCAICLFLLSSSQTSSQPPSAEDLSPPAATRDLLAMSRTELHSLGDSLSRLQFTELMEQQSQRFGMLAPTLGRDMSGYPSLSVPVSVAFPMEQLVVAEHLLGALEPLAEGQVLGVRELLAAVELRIIAHLFEADPSPDPAPEVSVEVAIRLLSALASPLPESVPTSVSSAVEGARAEFVDFTRRLMERMADRTLERSAAGEQPMIGRDILHSSFVGRWSSTGLISLISAALAEPSLPWNGRLAELEPYLLSRDLYLADASRDSVFHSFLSVAASLHSKARQIPTRTRRIGVSQVTERAPRSEVSEKILEEFDELAMRLHAELTVVPSSELANHGHLLHVAAQHSHRSGSLLNRLLLEYPALEQTGASRQFLTTLLDSNPAAELDRESLRALVSYLIAGSRWDEVGRGLELTRRFGLATTLRTEVVDALADLFRRAPVERLIAEMVPIETPPEERWRVQLADGSVVDIVDAPFPLPAGAKMLPTPDDGLPLHPPPPPEPDPFEGRGSAAREMREQALRLAVEWRMIEFEGELIDAFERSPSKTEVRIALDWLSRSPEGRARIENLLLRDRESWRAALAVQVYLGKRAERLVRDEVAAERLLEIARDATASADVRRAAWDAFARVKSQEYRDMGRDVKDLKPADLP